MRPDNSDTPAATDADHGGNGRARSGFWSTVVHSTARLFELEARIILLQLLNIMQRAMMRAVWVAVGAMLLLAGAVFLYIAIFKTLLLLMPALAVWFVFAGVHLFAGALLLLWGSGGVAHPRAAASADNPGRLPRDSAQTPANAPPTETLP